MKKLEFLNVMRSLKNLYERGTPDAALELINELIEDAETGRNSKIRILQTPNK